MESRFKTASGKVALFSVMIAVTVITNLIMVPMPYPLAQYDLSPVLIYTLGVLVSPLLAGTIVATAMAIGVGYKMMIYGFPPVFIVGAMVVRGIEAALISYLVRMKDPIQTSTVTPWEIIAMAIGAVWETVGFFLADWYLFGLAFAMTVLLTIVDVIFIPVAIGVITAVRSRLGLYRLL